MSKFESMDNDELDRLLGEIVKLTHTYNTCTGEMDILVDGEWVDWNPTDNNSAQLQRFVFPRLLSMVAIDINQTTNNIFYIEIEQSFHDGKGNLSQKIIADFETGNPDKINRTIAICCLEAWEVISEK